MVRTRCDDDANEAPQPIADFETHIKLNVFGVGGEAARHPQWVTSIATVDRIKAEWLDGSKGQVDA
ncbi:MAG: hypothetical protein AAFU56_10120 [Pseudomonadota bacterium]